MDVMYGWTNGGFLTSWHLYIGGWGKMGLTGGSRRFGSVEELPRKSLYPYESQRYGPPVDDRIPQDSLHKCVVCVCIAYNGAEVPHSIRLNS